MNKRGQAAMEFLMTYGWAILVVLIAIGALAYFGVLNPGKFLPSSCTIGPGIGCDDFKVTADSVLLVLRNGLGSDLTKVWVSIDDCNLNESADGGITPTYDVWIDGSILAGNVGQAAPYAHLTLNQCTDNGVLGSRFKKDIKIGYLASSGVQHNITGSMTTKVEQG